MTSDGLVVPVVAACIVQDETVLLSERLTAREPSTLGKWEFPGGVAHLGEALEDALRREILEELGFPIIPGRILHARINTYDSGTDYLVVFFECALLYSVKRFIDNVHWVHPQEIIMGKYDVLPGTVEAAKVLCEKVLG